MLQTCYKGVTINKNNNVTTCNSCNTFVTPYIFVYQCCNRMLQCYTKKPSVCNYFAHRKKMNYLQDNKLNMNPIKTALFNNKKPLNPMQPETQTQTHTHTHTGHTGEAYQNEEQKIFMDYVYTLQTLQLRLKGVEENDFVHIPMQEVIERRFFKYPNFSAKKQLRHLVEIGALEMQNSRTPCGRKMYQYRSLRLGAFTPFLVKDKVFPIGDVSRFMLETLKKVCVNEGTPINPYFTYFLKYINQYPKLFFTIDKFSGRIHTPVTSFPAKDRINILIDGKQTASIDVATMQPIILGYILKSMDRLRNNEFSKWIDQGEDVYLMLAQKAKLESREQGKKRFFEIIFARPSNELASIFGNAAWIGWINGYKRKRVNENPYTDRKRHSNLAWLLQKTEVFIMKKIWIKLYETKIEFLTIHDEIIVQEENLSKTYAIMEAVLKEYFPYYKLNINKSGNN